MLYINQSIKFVKMNELVAILHMAIIKLILNYSITLQINQNKKNLRYTLIKTKKFKLLR